VGSEHEGQGSRGSFLNSRKGGIKYFEMLGWRRTCKEGEQGGGRRGEYSDVVVSLGFCPLILCEFANCWCRGEKCRGGGECQFK